jgi:hypothetical protein
MRVTTGVAGMIRRSAGYGCRRHVLRTAVSCRLLPSALLSRRDRPTSHIVVTRSSEVTRMSEHGTPRTRLEQVLRQRRWTVDDLRRQFARLSGSELSERQAYRWLSGDLRGRPYPHACATLEQLFGESAARLLGQPSDLKPDLATASLETLLITAGRESAEHALNSAAALDPGALEALHSEAERLARAYYTAAPLTLLSDLVRLRDTVYVQLDRTHKPRQRAELYLIAGQVCGLMSSVAFDLGHADSAEGLARAAYTYGRVIDHPSLCTWARALTMSVLLWAGRYREVTTVATTAVELAPAGTPRARLYAVRARGLAHLGAAEEVTADLAASADELDRSGDDELMDRVGGELGFDHSRRALCAGAAYVALHDGDRGQTEAETALDLFTVQPEPLRWRAGELSARTDLATARALSGDLAGAEDALTAVFVLPVEHRTEALTQRLGNLGRLLSTRPYRGAVEAGRIGEAVADFTARALPRTTATLELPHRPALPGV